MANLGYADSFKELGYVISNPINQWSAENETGVCLSLWQDEFRSESGLLELDTTKDCGEIDIWPAVGKNLRFQHLVSACDKFDSWVDVVIRSGGPEDGATSTYPWIVSKRRNHKFRVQTFDRDTGHFSLKLEPCVDS